MLVASLSLGYSLAPARPSPSAHAARAAVLMVDTNTNVAQTEDTSREKVMTFSYDMSLEPEYEKPTYKGTGNGLSGDEGEYDIVVIGSGMGGLACGAISAKYGHKVLVLESHIKPGGSAHTFSRMHDGGKYSFEVGPSIFEGCARAAPCACAVPTSVVCAIPDAGVPAAQAGPAFLQPAPHRFRHPRRADAGRQILRARLLDTNGVLAIPGRQRRGECRWLPPDFAGASHRPGARDQAVGRVPRPAE